MESYGDKITQSLIEEGASLVGFADLSGLSPDITKSFPYAISIAVALNPAIMAKIHQGPTADYFEEYKRVNLFLSDLGKFAAKILVNLGFKTFPIEPTTEHFDLNTLSTFLPHKTIATRAGLGWIGKSALLTTKQYGSALRLTSVLTDCPLPTVKPINQSQCGDCRLCVESCPGHAPLGNNWDINLPRESFFNAFTCRETAIKLSQPVGIEGTVCGICIVSCPWTQQYLTRHKPNSC
ncbi:MAG: epoxyqueuosine reductase [Candidatus Atribacteria bacterium]|nr:epoxyqueuosine reductase [Candidatus Atribacteria bacterium]